MYESTIVGGDFYTQKKPLSEHPEAYERRLKRKSI